MVSQQKFATIYLSCSPHHDPTRLPSATSTFHLRGRESKTGPWESNCRPSIIDKISSHQLFSSQSSSSPRLKKHLPFPQNRATKKKSNFETYTKFKSWATAAARHRLSHRCQTANRRSRLLRPPFQETSMTFPSECLFTPLLEISPSACSVSRHLE